MRTPAAALALATAACGLGVADDTSGGRDALPITGAGPFEKLALDNATPVEEPWIAIDPILELGEPAILLRDGGGVHAWITRESADPPEGDTQIWFTEIPDLRDLPPPYTPVLVADLPWEDGRVGAPAIVPLPDRLVMFYAGGTAIGRAESTDGGRTWTKRAEPVLTGAISPGAAFDGTTWLLAFVDPAAPGAAIHLARSTDGVTFTRDPEPVLVPRGVVQEDFEAYAVTAPSLGWLVEGTGRGHWALWYAGAERPPPTDTRIEYAVGYAASFDGTDWQRIAGGRPIVSAPAGAPAVALDGNRGVLAFDALEGRRMAVGVAETP